VSNAPDGSEDSDDAHAIDAAFDEIVANIDRPNTAASTTPWPEAEDATVDPPPPPVTPAPQRTPRREWSEWNDIRVPEAEPSDEPIEEPSDEDEGHYVPPPPPPLPKGDAAGRWAWAGAIGAPILAILLPILGRSIDGLTGIALVVAFLAGFGTLIARLRPGPRVDEGPDDGAVV
jgi:hypothetical protein